MIPDKIHRHRVVTLAGCYRNKKGASISSLEELAESYVNWVAAESLMDSYGITPQEADKAWYEFIERQNGDGPFLGWRGKERAYEQSLLMEQK